MKAVVLLGHGSRAPQAAEGLDRVAAELQRRRPHGVVKTAHMELCEPSLATVVTQLVAEGTREIVVLPYFLHAGNHLREDIPQLIRELALIHSEVRFSLGPHLGYDDELVTLVERRLEAVLHAPQEWSWTAGTGEARGPHA